MKTNEMRGKSRQEIIDEVGACRRELLNMQFQWLAGETRNPAQKKSIRRNIARLKTIIREIELGIHPIIQG